VGPVGLRLVCDGVLEDSVDMLIVDFLGADHSLDHTEVVDRNRIAAKDNLDPEDTESLVASGTQLQELKHRRADDDQAVAFDASTAVLVESCSLGER
jgi:hypothetical protein